MLVWNSTAQFSYSSARVVSKLVVENEVRCDCRSASVGVDGNSWTIWIGASTCGHMTCLGSVHVCVTPSC